MLAVASLLLAGCEGSSDVPSDQAATDEGGAEAVDPVAVQEVAQTAIDAGTDPGPWVFGHDGSDLETVAVSELTAAPEKFANRKVLVHGTVTSVCQARGCWVEVTDERGDKVVAASFDHGVVLPRNSADLQIDLVGTMYPDPVEEGEAQSYTFSLDGATLRRSNPTEG
jgi:hypothetical protein